MIEDDPGLEGVGLVIFDEFHERSLEADLGLALALDTRKHLRGDLRLLVMSATIEGGKVAELLGDAPMVASQGRSFPVEIRHLPRPMPERFEAGVASAITRALDDESGSVLVFLPGGAEIRRVARISENRGCPRMCMWHRFTVISRPMRRMKPCARTAGQAQSGAGDLDRRDQPDHRGHSHRHRWRLDARAALRARQRHDPADNDPGVAGLGQTAQRPRRTARTRHRLSPLARGRGGAASPFQCAGNSRSRSGALGLGAGAMGNERSERHSLARQAPRSRLCRG